MTKKWGPHKFCSEMPAVNHSISRYSRRKYSDEGARNFLMARASVFFMNVSFFIT